MNLKQIVISLVLLLLMAMPTAAEYKFSDFLPSDPVQDLKDLGVWDTIVLIVGVLFLIAIISAITAVLTGFISINVGAVTKSTSLTHHGNLSIARVVVGGIIAIMAISIVLYFWNGA
jgi:hypothetical protein